MQRVQIWAHAARPKTLIASISPAMIGATLAIGHGTFDLLIFLCTLFTGLWIQIGTNLANDYFDFIKGADTDERKGFLRVTQANLVTLKAMKRAIVITFGFALCTGCYLIAQGGVFIAVLLSLYILLSILYTAGPYPLAYLGLGEVFVLFFYGPGAVIITYYLQAQTLSLEAFLAGVSPGALSMALITLNNVRDIEEDRAAHKKTLAVRFGKTFGKYQFLFAFLLALSPLCFFYQTHPFCLLSVAVVLPALFIVTQVFKHKDPRELNQLFGKTGQLLWLYTLLFCIGYLL